MAMMRATHITTSLQMTWTRQVPNISGRGASVRVQVNPTLYAMITKMNAGVAPRRQPKLSIGSGTPPPGALLRLAGVDA